LPITVAIPCCCRAAARACGSIASSAAVRYTSPTRAASWRRSTHRAPSSSGVSDLPRRRGRESPMRGGTSTA
jgi:hypothetical protein